MDDTGYDEYNPHPYRGGYDQAEVYGKPKSPSEETCYAPQPTGSVSFTPYDYGSEASAYGGEQIDREWPKTDPANGIPDYQVGEEEMREYDWGWKRNGEFDYIEFGYQSGEKWKPNREFDYPQQEEEPSYNYDIPRYPQLEEQPYYNYDTPVYPHMAEQSSYDYDTPNYYGYDPFGYCRAREGEESYQPPEDVRLSIPLFPAFLRILDHSCNELGNGIECDVYIFVKNNITKHRSLIKCFADLK